MRTIAGSAARIVLPDRAGAIAGSAAAVVLDWQFYAHTCSASAVFRPQGTSHVVRLRIASASGRYRPQGQADVARLRLMFGAGVFRPEGRASIDRNLNVEPDLTASVRAAWGHSEIVSASARVSSWPSTPVINTDRQVKARAIPMQASPRIIVGRASSAIVQARAKASQAERLATIAFLRAEQASILAVSAQHSASHAEPLLAGAWLHSLRSMPLLVAPRAKSGQAEKLAQIALVVMGRAVPLVMKIDVRWGHGKFPVGIRPVSPNNPLPPPVWNEGEPGIPLILPLRDYYHMVNTAYVKRVDDNSEIECKRVSIESDGSSWSRRFSLDVFHSELSKVSVENGPVEIEIGANGGVWRAVITRMGEHLAYNANTLSVSGLSKSYVLGDKYAIKRTGTNSVDGYLSAIAIAELDPHGWQMLWNENLVDALVPAGVYSIVQSTPIVAVKRLVEAVGGFVSTHRTGLALIGRRRYPVMPWEIAGAAADVVLPIDAIKAMDLDWQDPPFINGVYVSGGRVGKLSLVRRTGTNGAILGDMIVDDLLTSSASNGARGAAALADSVTRKAVQITMDIYPETGVLEPGQIVEIVGAYTWKGIVRGSTVNIEWSADSLKVKQGINVERFYVSA